MGERVAAAELAFDGRDRERFRSRLTACQDVFEKMLAQDLFEKGRKLCGIELEIHLIDGQGRPSMVNRQVLERIASPDFQTEIGLFNLEMNIAPHKIVGTVFSELREEMDTALHYADRVAGGYGAGVALIGVLPTLDEAHLVRENFTDEDRYVMLNDQIAVLRGEDFRVRIEGEREELDAAFPTIMPEACCTSVQFHLQVTPDGFARAWNAAQAIAGPQVALGANSPFLLGKKLWHETRIALFEQATDFRTVEIAAQGVRPRVWFGERWVRGPAELFRENIKYFTSLLPRVGGEDSEAVLAAGGIPPAELRLHNGTVYRWNRPVYDVARGKPHLRVENRVLPAGPTVLDVLANAAFFYGLVRALADEESPVWRRLAFSDARDNLHRAAREGIGAEMTWPGVGTVPVGRLVIDVLLPLAARGLDSWRIDPRERDLYLGIIEGRARTGRNGAVWQIEQVDYLEQKTGMSRPEAIAAMTRRYAKLGRHGAPVHTWPVGGDV